MKYQTIIAFLVVIILVVACKSLSDGSQRIDYLGLYNLDTDYLIDESGILKEHQKEPYREIYEKASVYIKIEQKQLLMINEAAGYKKKVETFSYRVSGDTIYVNDFPHHSYFLLQKDLLYAKENAGSLFIYRKVENQ